MSASMLVCPHCGKDDFVSKRGLSQHISKTAACARKEFAVLQGRDEGYMTANEFMELTEVKRRNKRSKVVAAHENFPKLHHKSRDEPKDFFPLAQECYETAREEEEDDNLYPQQDDSDATDDEETEARKRKAEEEKKKPDTSILEDFDKYLSFADENIMEFSHDERVAIELMWVLRRTKASLDTYEAIMEWHFRAGKKLRRHENVGSYPHYISRPLLFKLLSQRYNTAGKYNLVKEITLPSSRAKAKIIKNDVKACMQSLLTDPRIMDEDYLFFNDDPFSPPPDNLDYVSDINTGLSYTETYKKLITKPGKQVLLPVIFYIDASHTGQFANLPVTALKFTLGIFNRKARDMPHMWRILGYLPVISKHKSRGRRKLQESGHVDAVMAHQDMQDGEGNVANPNACTAQDLHTMLATIMEEYVQLQNRGFIWDLMYKGKEYKGIEFVLFTPLIKCDTEEADRLCGHYISRTAGVSQLCRYCCCPTRKSDQPRADYPRKTKPMIVDLIENEDMDGLQELSQQFIDNAWYAIQFGKHNEESVHGACPLEMLHALCLGIFKYVRDCFFEQIGETSKLSAEINALAIEYGELFGRQSDRDMPKTKFSNGIQKGKLMAKEYPGVLLIIAAILRSTEGRRLLKGKKSSAFADDEGIEDWSIMVETLLMWEVWLKSEKMSKHHVHRSKKKHLYIMYLVRKVGNRVKGMGLKIVKFHAIMHMSMDIIHFGVPMVYDTGSDEAGHKPSKTAAKLTQKRRDTFDIQLGNRLQEIYHLDMAMQEIRFGRPLTEYFEGYWHPRTRYPPVIPKKKRLGGGKFVVLFDVASNQNVLELQHRKKANQRIRVERPFVDFVAALSNCVAGHINNLQVRTSHYRNEAVFRGSPMHAGAVWRDWVMVDWADDGILPNKIWGFVDLRALPQDNEIVCGGLTGIPPGFYAIVESAEYNKAPRGAWHSEILVPITKEVEAMRQQRVTKLQFYLADVEAFVEPVTVIPDIGGAANGYFMLRGRGKWSEDFGKWLLSPYEDFEDFEEDSEESDEDGQYDGSEPEDDESSDDEE